MLRSRSQSWIRIKLADSCEWLERMNYLGIVAIGPVKDQLGEDQVVYSDQRGCLFDSRTTTHLGN